VSVWREWGWWWGDRGVHVGRSINTKTDDRSV
jgi:hypothetical protein